MIESPYGRAVQWYYEIKKFNSEICIANRGLFRMDELKPTGDDFNYFVKSVGRTCFETIKLKPMSFSLNGCVDRKVALFYTLKAYKHLEFEQGEVIGVNCTFRTIAVMGTRGNIFIKFDDKKYRAYTIKATEEHRPKLQEISRNIAEKIISEARKDAHIDNIFERKINLE